MPAPPLDKTLNFCKTPDSIRQESQDARTRAYDRLAGIAAGAAPDACEALDGALGDLEAETAAATFLKYVSPDPALRAAAHEAETQGARFLVDVFAREDLYAAVKAGPPEGLPPEAARLREKTLDQFRRSGLDLGTLDRARLTLLQKQLLDLELTFGKNLNEVRTYLAATKADLDGLPDEFVAGLARLDDGRYKVTLDYPDALPFMANARRPEARERLHRLTNSRGVPENVALLEEILSLRRRAAGLVGAPSFAHHILSERMAKSPEAVMAFLSRLRRRLDAKAGPERERLLALKRRDEPGAERLEAWDVAYYHNQLKKTAYAVDEFELMEYFPADRVIAGLLELCSGLFSLRFTPAPAAAWHPDVRAFDCADSASGRILGRFYLDLFPREGKFKHAAVFPLVRGQREADGSYRKPSAAMVVNFSPPAGGRPSLLKHSEVETLFHEFGHVLHNLLTESPYHRFAGTRVARDFLEAPSQIMENWAWDRGVLRSLSGHWRDGRPLPDALSGPLLSSRHVDSGIFSLRQLAFALIDQALHTAEAGDPGEVYKRLYSEVTTFDVSDDTRPEAGFGHLMSYAASYYGYLWSDVYSADMFSAFAASGDVLSPALGARYRKTVLAPGGSREEGGLVREFLGREPSEDAFLRSLGLEGRWT